MKKEEIKTCRFGENEVIAIDEMVACRSCGRDDYYVYVNFTEKKLEMVCKCCDFEIKLPIVIEDEKQHDEIPDDIRWKRFSE